jgi:molecular chaperone GrpE (heat shock protein)
MAWRGMAHQADNQLLSTLLEGVRMTDTQLQKVFQANKIVKVSQSVSQEQCYQHYYYYQQ